MRQAAQHEAVAPRRGGVLVVGSANMDLAIEAGRIPRPGETLLGGEFRTAPGGKGANQAVAAARFGAGTALCGRIGADAIGAELEESLKASGVDTILLKRVPGAATGVAVIVVQPSGENSIVVASGANMRLRPDGAESARPWFESARVALIQFEIPLDTVERALELSRECGCLSILDPAPAVKVEPDLLAKADALTPNETEAAALLGRDLPDMDAVRDAARAFRGMGVGRVVVKLGERGALLCDDEGCRHFPGYRIAPVDTTAAGDAFAGALGAALALNEEWPEAVGLANAAGALACLAPGAQPSLPDREAIESFMKTAKERKQ